MKKIMLLSLGLIIAAVCFAQTDPAVGFWLSVDENSGNVTAGWQIYIENGELRGRILSLPNEPKGVRATNCNASYRGFPLSGAVNQMEVAGPPWIFGLTRRAAGDWRGGNIIDPNDGRMYSCRVMFHPAGTRSGNRNFTVDTLEVRGEIGLGIGRSQFWRKSTQGVASSLWPMQ